MKSEAYTNSCQGLKGQIIEIIDTCFFMNLLRLDPLLLRIFEFDFAETFVTKENSDSNNGDINRADSQRSHKHVTNMSQTCHKHVTNMS